MASTKPPNDWVKGEVKRLGIDVKEISRSPDIPAAEEILEVPTDSHDADGGIRDTTFSVNVFYPSAANADKWELFANDESFLPSDINKIIVGLLALKDALREAGYNVDEEE